MIPGLAKGPPFPKKATKDAIVAIASIRNPSVPRVVGVCEVDVASLAQVQGVKGHAVRSEHWDGDELWEWGSNGRPGGATPQQIDGWISEDTGKTLPQEMDALIIEDSDKEDEGGGVPLHSKQKATEPWNEHVEGEDGEPFEKTEEKHFSVKGMFVSVVCRGAPLNLQKSMTHFGRHFFMPFTVFLKPINPRSTTVFPSLFLNHL